jgi:hypothetical protein
MSYCDNDCGKDELLAKEEHWVGTLLIPVATANQGESAVLCEECFEAYKKDVEAYLARPRKVCSNTLMDAVERGDHL